MNVVQNRLKGVLQMAKKYYMVLDCETVTSARVPYDVAYIIVTRTGEVVERFNALTAEVVGTPTGRCVLAADSFAKRKAAFYLAENAPAEVMPFECIAEHVHDAICAYDCTVVAYNAAFDVHVLNAYARTVTGCEFFPINTPVWDLWTMSLYTVCASRKYGEFCELHQMRTDSGNIRTSAESVFSYLTDNSEFAEEHTALADCEIESEIFRRVLKRKKKLHTNYCNGVQHHEPWCKYCKR
jgi:hypothetical protein